MISITKHRTGPKYMYGTYSTSHRRRAR